MFFVGSIKMSRQPFIDEHWEVREWTEKDAYGTSIPGLSVYRNGMLIAEGPLDKSPYRRSRIYIPKLSGLSEKARQAFMGKRR